LIGGADAGLFSTSLVGPVELQPGETVTLDVTYAPLVSGSHAANLSLVHSGDNSPLAVLLSGTSVDPVLLTPLYRINVGGPALLGSPEWEADDSASPSPYGNAVLAGTSVFGTAVSIDVSHPSIPAETLPGLFQTERWDPTAGAEMEWNFPVSAGDYEVRLYFADIYTGTHTVGARVFDVWIEDQLVLDNYDIFADVGGFAGVVKSFTVASDSNLNIDFGHVVENPSLKAIEILPAQPRAGQLDVNVTFLDMGELLIGETTTRGVTIRNQGGPGDPDIIVTGTSMIGADAAQFADTYNEGLPVTLAPGQSYSFDVIYAPTVVGSHLATLAIEHDGQNTPNLLPLSGMATNNIPIGFGKSTLMGATVQSPTSLQFGPDDRLYVASQTGLITIYDVVRNSANDYSVTTTETISLIQSMPNHDDSGNLQTYVINRLVTGLLVTGTAENPVIYVMSSDPRIGAGPSGEDLNLDTNSGILSRLTWDGSQWSKLDLVRGLPRSEENHHANGMALDPTSNTLFIAQGGNTNLGAPSNNFAFLPEYALSAAILSVDLDAIGDATYDLPTLDDEDRPGVSDANDPFGGNNGKNQAILVAGGPVQVYSPGFRNPYDVVITESGLMYSIDNGGNGGWGGIPIGTGEDATNEVSEPGFTELDNLHLVTPGFYGGHPNPTRANINNTFNDSNPQSPVFASNPIEGTHLDAGSEDGALLLFSNSTNGLTEYTASNFGGGMRGNLITASFDNHIYRVVLNATGTAVVQSETLFNSVGTVPLDVTAVGDTGPFPGTIWAGDYLQGTIIAFEPNDYETGGGGVVDPNDLDGDGYSNDDELANGTNPNSAADFPPDWDEDFLSNLLDADDDNDTLTDEVDPFAIDPANGRNTSFPVLYTWENDAPQPGGILNLGFTGLMSNGVANYESLYDRDLLTAGGAAGVLTLDAVSEGDALGTNNTQQQAFQFGVDVTATTPPVTAHTRIVGPFNGLVPQPGQQMGLFIGNGDQDNYVKIVVDGVGGIRLLSEVAGVVASDDVLSVSLPGPSTIDLYLTLDPATATVRGAYSLNSGSTPGTLVDMGMSLSVPSAWWTGPIGLAVGIISTTSDSELTFPATWDFVEVTTETVEAPTASAQVVVNTGNSLNSSTYLTNSFQITNTSLGGERIASVRFDVSTALLPDMVFDPFGLAGDLTAKDFTLDSSDAVGLLGHNYLVPHDGGFDVLEIVFEDFDPGEQLGFSIDVDPTTIRGSSAPGPNQSGSVSGLELVGTTVTVTYEGGAIHQTQVFRTPSHVGSSENIVKAAPLSAPDIELLGVTTPGNVTQPQQTVRVSGPVGAAVRLLLVEGGLFLGGLPAGGFDVDLFEANTATAVQEQSAIIGALGYVDIPVTLFQTVPEAGIFHIVAALDDTDDSTGLMSEVLVVQYSVG
jgi:hypothetical protein